MIQSIKTSGLYQKTHRIGKYNKLQDTKTIKFIIFIYELITCILWELHLTVMQTQLSSFQWIFPSNPLAFHCVSLRYQDTLSPWDPAAIPAGTKVTIHTIPLVLNYDLSILTRSSPPTPIPFTEGSGYKCRVPSPAPIHSSLQIILCLTVTSRHCISDFLGSSPLGADRTP